MVTVYTIAEAADLWYLKLPEYQAALKEHYRGWKPVCHIVAKIPAGRAGDTEMRWLDATVRFFTGEYNYIERKPELFITIFKPV